MKQNTAVLLFLCWLYCLPAVAQHYYYNNQYYDKALLFETGVSVGVANCLTDIGGRPGNGKKFLRDLNWQNTKMSGGIFVGFNYRYALSGRFELNLAKVVAYDSILKYDHSESRNRYLRNLHFKSAIVDLMLLAELHPWVFFQTDGKATLWSPYLVGGAGFFHFNPMACLDGEWIALNKLRTEGQGFAEYPERAVYKLTQIIFPVGFGIKIECSALLNVRIEVLHRITRTDYLDDVSTRYIDPNLFTKYLSPGQAAYALQLHNRQRELDPDAVTVPGAIRGNSSRNDAYFTMQCKLGLVIGRERR